MTSPVPYNPASVHFDDIMPPRFEGTVWHYTSAAGVLGMLTSDSIWGSSVTQQNDRSELSHGFDVIEAQWASYRGRSISTRPEIDGWMKEARARLNASVLADSYIVCGSTIGHSQTQFLLYGSYAVGINGAVPLTKAIVKHAELVREYEESGQFTTGWRHVIYDEPAKRSHVDKLLEKLGHLASVLRDDPSQAPNVSGIAIESIFRSAAYMKDKSFVEEREVRLYGRADTTRAELSFRVGKYGIVPYIQVELSGTSSARGFPIVQINLGPGLPEPSSAQAGLRIALDRFGLEHVEIVNHVGARRV